MFVYVCTYQKITACVCVCVCMIVYPMYVMHVCNACMYACMPACMHVCMIMHVCLHVCMCACRYVCTYARMYVCMYECMYVCMYVCICMYVIAVFFCVKSWGQQEALIGSNRSPSFRTGGISVSWNKWN